MGLWMLLLLFHSWHGPDIWYHLTWGRDLVDFGRFLPKPPVLLTQPIPANGYWLFQSLMYLAYKLGGIYLVSAIFALVWLAVAALWLKISGMWRRPLGLWFCAAFVVVMQLRFEQRPEVFSYLFLTLMMWLGTRPKIWPLFVVQILWTNCHGFFVLGPVLAAALIYHRERNWHRALAVGAGLLAATLINPFGYKVWSTVLLYLKFGGALKDLNHELMMPAIWPLYWPAAVFWLAWLATLAMIVHSLARRVNLIPALLAIGGLYLGGSAIRNMPLLFLLAPLLWSEFRYEGPARLKLPMTAALTSLALALCGAVVFGRYHGWTGSLSTFGVKLEKSSYPIGATEYLQQGRFQGKMFNDSYDGGYLEFHLNGVEIAGDSYFTDAAQTRRFFDAIKQPSALMKLTSELRFDVLLINIENTDIMNQLLDSKDWVPAYADSHRTLFVNRFSNPHLSGDLAKFTYYTGENLRQWTYEYGVVSWMVLAFQRQNAALLKKIVSDLRSAPVIPADAYNIAVKYVSLSQDEETAQVLAGMRDRVK